MNVNQEIIKQTVLTLLRMNAAETVSLYINNAITSHRQILPHIKPTIEYNGQHVFIFYAESHLTKIELIGFENKDNALRKEKKIRLLLEKDSKFIENLLIVLYTNIASNIQL